MTIAYMTFQVRRAKQQQQIPIGIYRALFTDVLSNIRPAKLVNGMPTLKTCAQVDLHK